MGKAGIGNGEEVYPEGSKEDVQSRSLYLDLSCLLTSSKEELSLLAHVHNPRECSRGKKKPKQPKEKPQYITFIHLEMWYLLPLKKVHYKPTEVRLPLICTRPGHFLAVLNTGVMFALLQSDSSSLT